MPKCATGRPRGRPAGTRDVRLLSQLAIYIALSAWLGLNDCTLPVSQIARDLSDPKTRVRLRRYESLLLATIEPRASLTQEQLDYALHYNAQKLSGSRRCNYLNVEPGRSFVIASAGLLLLLLRAQNLYSIGF